MNEIYSGSKNASVWIEKSCIGKGWKINNHHILTGIPENSWTIDLPAGVCLDMIHHGESLWCIRPYGFQDTFEGVINDVKTVWIGKPALDNGFIRGLLKNGFLDENIDIQFAGIFPIIDLNTLEIEGFIQALLLGNASEYLDLYLSLPRLTAATIEESVKIDMLSIRREIFRYDNSK